MASGITYRKKDWLVLSVRFFKSLFSPWKPVNRIIGMLEQIRAFLLS
jgi:hypothetical protein